MVHEPSPVQIAPEISHVNFSTLSHISPRSVLRVEKIDISLPPCLVPTKYSRAALCSHGIHPLLPNTAAQHCSPLRLPVGGENCGWVGHILKWLPFSSLRWRDVYLYSCKSIIFLSSVYVDYWVASDSKQAWNIYALGKIFHDDLVFEREGNTTRHEGAVDWKQKPLHWHYWTAQHDRRLTTEWRRPLHWAALVRSSRGISPLVLLTIPLLAFVSIYALRELGVHSEPTLPGFTIRDSLNQGREYWAKFILAFTVLCIGVN